MQCAKCLSKPFDGIIARARYRYKGQLDHLLKARSFRILGLQLHHALLLLRCCGHPYYHLAFQYRERCCHDWKGLYQDDAVVKILTDRVPPQGYPWDKTSEFCSLTSETPCAKIAFQLAHRCCATMREASNMASHMWPCSSMPSQVTVSAIE